MPKEKSTPPSTGFSRGALAAIAAAALVLGAFLGLQAALVILSGNEQPHVAGRGMPPAGMAPPGAGGPMAPPEAGQMPAGGMGMPGAPGAGEKAAAQAAAKERIAGLSRAAAENPRDPEAWAHLGHAYFDADTPKEAIEAYTKSLQLKPDQPDTLTDMGVMYRRNDEPEKGIESFDKALAIQPNHKIALFNKGIVLFHDLGDSKGALAAWEKLLAIDPNVVGPNGMSVRALVDSLRNEGSSGMPGKP
jgi:tetratricopeptide (TPR) repeat protein